MADIGYQDGIEAFHNYFRKLGVWADAFRSWAALTNEQRAITPPPLPPRIPSRGPNYDENDLTTWPWPDKHERLERILKDDHDAAVEPLPEPPPSTNNPWDSGYAPQAYNKGSRGQNARYNIRINCTQRPDGKYVDKKGVVYSDSGLLDSAGRTEAPVDGLKPADMMDGKDPWEQYEWLGKLVGPNKENYPAASYQQ